MKLHPWIRTIAYLSVGITVISIIVSIIISANPIFSFNIPFSLKPFGLLLISMGILLASWSVNLFAKVGKGTPAIYDPPKKFVTIGPYKYVRNPMYIAGLSIIFGVSLLVQNSNLLISAFVYWFILHIFLIAIEEPQLERRFGKAYLEYKRKIPRWIPKF